MIENYLCFCSSFLFISTFRDKTRESTGKKLMPQMAPVSLSVRLFSCMPAGTPVFHGYIFLVYVDSMFNFAFYVTTYFKDNL